MNLGDLYNAIQSVTERNVKSGNTDIQKHINFKTIDSPPQPTGTYIFNQFCPTLVNWRNVKST